MIPVLFLALCNLGNAQTIADLLKQNPDLSQVAATIDAHPEWSGKGPITLVAPTNAAIAAQKNLPKGDLGIFELNSVFEYKDVHYTVLEQQDKEKILIWGNLIPDLDNYSPGTVGNPSVYVAGKMATPEVHLRHGLGDATLAAMIKADNGWLYISNGAIPPPGTPSETLAYLGCNALLRAIVTSGLKDTIDGLNGVTIFAPTDAALTAAEPYLSTLSPSQLKAVLLYHIVPKVIYSTEMGTDTVSTLLAGNQLPITSGMEGATVGAPPAGGKNDLGDNFIAKGVIHRVGYVLQPPSLPGASVDVSPANVPAGSTQGSVSNTTGSGNDAGSDAPAEAEDENAGYSLAFGVSLIVTLCVAMTL